MKIIEIETEAMLLVYRIDLIESVALNKSQQTIYLSYNQESRERVIPFDTIDDAIVVYEGIKNKLTLFKERL